MSAHDLPTHCTVDMWTVEDGQAMQPSQKLGETTWEELLADVERHGGTRLTYDLFDVPHPDGTLRRYRAVDVQPAQA